MNSVQRMLKILFFSLVCSLLTSCSDSAPTIRDMRPKPEVVSVPKDPKNFAQLNAASGKETTSGGYKGNFRVSQPGAQFHSQSGAGYTLQGTVNLQR